MKLFGTFYFIAEKEELIEKINNLLNDFGRKGAQDNKQGQALLKSYCHSAIKLINKYFATDLRSVRKCIKRLDSYAANDNAELMQARMIDVYDTLVNLRTIVENSVQLSDSPSCKDMLDLTVEDAVAIANDFNKNRALKSLTILGLLGKKIGDAITIVDIKAFYQDKIDGLYREINEDDGKATSTEHYLMSKFKCELGYCYKAIAKTGVGLFKDVYDIAKIAEDDIRAYESISTKQVGQIDSAIVG